MSKKLRERRKRQLAQKIERRECGAKTPYGDEEAAQEFAEQLKAVNTLSSRKARKHGSRELAVYKCPHCSYWHIGHRIQKEQTNGKV